MELRFDAEGQLKKKTFFFNCLHGRLDVMCYANDQAQGIKKELYCEFLPVVIVDYHYDNLGRRTNVSNSGTAFSSVKFNEFGYNDRSELTSSNRYTGNLGDTSQPVTAENRAYAYDPIGNRKTATEAAKQLTYTANQLNQYALISSSVGWASPTAYDTDGNLISASAESGVGLVGCASRTVFDYDAENRLISVAPETPVDGATKVEYVYDYMSRRAQKKISTYTSGSWSLTASTTYLYDGWNLIAEKTSHPSPVTSFYVWGSICPELCKAQAALAACLHASLVTIHSSRVICMTATATWRSS